VANLGTLNLLTLLNFMLRLSKKTDYAIVAVSHLQKQRQPASAREIAAQYGLPAQLVANVLKTLSSNGILQSKRGAAGGYELSKEPDRITVGDVIRAIEGPWQFSDCSSIEKNCQAAGNCPAKTTVISINKKIESFMDNLTLTDIL